MIKKGLPLRCEKIPSLKQRTTDTPIMNKMINDYFIIPPFYNIIYQIKSLFFLLLLAGGMFYRALQFPVQSLLATFLEEKIPDGLLMLLRSIWAFPLFAWQDLWLVPELPLWVKP